MLNTENDDNCKTAYTPQKLLCLQGSLGSFRECRPTSFYKGLLSADETAELVYLCIPNFRYYGIIMYIKASLFGTVNLLASSSSCLTKQQQHQSRTARSRRQGSLHFYVAQLRTEQAFRLLKAVDA